MVLLNGLKSVQLYIIYQQNFCILIVVFELFVWGFQFRFFLMIRVKIVINEQGVVMKNSLVFVVVIYIYLINIGSDQG